MSQDIIIEGSAQEIASQIAKLEGTFRATLSAKNGAASSVPPAPVPSSSPAKEDAWTQDFRTWAAGHTTPRSRADVSRDTLYADRLR